MKKTIEKNDLPKYAGNYSRAKLLKKLAAVAKRISRKTLWYILLFYYTLESDEVSLGNKAIIMGALGYLIFPADIIPDVIPGLGLADDAAAIKLAYDTVKASITPEIERKATHKIALWFGEEPPTPADLIDEIKKRPGI